MGRRNDEHKQVEAEIPEQPQPPARKEPEVQPERPKKKGKKSSGWGVIAAAVAGGAGAAVAVTAAAKDRETKEHPEDKKEKPKAPEPEPEPLKNLERVVPVASSAADELDDMPPKIGPKPPSPRSSQMPGAFADDLDFTATLAAGLQSSGFDPNIVIDDPTFRRRDSPPGSDETFYKPPTAETVTDLGISRNEPNRSIENEDLMDDFETPTKLDKRGRKKLEKAAKRQSVDVVEEPSVPVELLKDDEPEKPKLSKKEPRRRDNTSRSPPFEEESSTTIV